MRLTIASISGTPDSSGMRSTAEPPLPASETAPSVKAITVAIYSYSYKISNVYLKIPYLLQCKVQTKNITIKVLSNVNYGNYIFLYLSVNLLKTYEGVFIGSVPYRPQTISTTTISVEFYLYPTVGTVLIHSVKPELTE